MTRPLRIAQVAPPFERVPPRAYGGTERIVHGLVTELDRRGHEVTTFASGDSVVPGRHIETVPQALRPLGYGGDSLPYMQLTLHEVLARATEFDIIHSHMEWASLLLARVSPVPVVSTFHGRLDLPYADAMFRDPPAGLVAISENQASTHPDVPWAAVVHNGLRLTDAPFGTSQRTDALCFVGRVAPEKGIVEAIDIALEAGRPLRIAAKAGPTATEREYFDTVFQPALKAAGRTVEFLGELDQADRDELFAQSYASLMPGSWPEPFGLVLIESLACGTPVIARRIGALPEILRDGIDGFFGDDVTAMAFKVDRVVDLDRRAIRESVLDRFSVERMTDRYLAVYRARLEAPEAGVRADAAGESDDGPAEPELLDTRRQDRMGALSGR
jgi:glycosyltransferase involved in cell wall biosynthesis